MRQIPILASRFVNQPEDVKQLLLVNGGVPVNDVFYPYWENNDDILFFYGGYGSGKSIFLVDKWIKKALTNDYFRGLYGRKVFDTNRVSVFKTFTDRIKERNLSSFFSYSEAENSSMIITCNHNGNTFTPFGADKIDKLKSIKDPTDIFCEELDQFSAIDFGVLISRLRTEKAKTQFVGAFNTTSVKREHWIKKVFFSDNKTDDVRLDGLSISKQFCNYPDNFFIDKEKYEKTLWLSAVYNRVKFNEISAGEWGADESGNPFCYTFDFNKNVKTTKLNPAWEVKLSFDFNCDPITCLVAQDNGNSIRCIEMIKLPVSNIYEICDVIKAKYGNCLLLVTGDATGRARSAMVKDNLNYFKIIKAQLGLGDRQMRQPVSNPLLVENRVLVNASFHQLDIEIDPVNCKGLISDLEGVSVLPDGSIEKQDRSDPDKQQDALACFRYYLNTFFKHILKLT